MVFSLSDEEIILFEHYSAPQCAEIGTSDITLQYKLSHFQRSEKCQKRPI